MTSLNPVLTIGKQMTESLELHLKLNNQAATARAIQLLEMVGVAEAERRITDYPHQFSGGMRQRVMIAMAMACNPKILIADEPTTALDVTIQAQVLEVMARLSREFGTAVIIITHNLGVVARYADRVNVMYAGRIIESASADTVYADPRHPYTIGLLNSVPRLDQKQGEKLIPIEGLPPDLGRLPPGCSFYARCTFRIDRCREEYPPLQLIEENHYAACWVDVRKGSVATNGK
jgi:oligopeptide/dipeptide ABC transporter ATP-binding protein